MNKFPTERYAVNATADKVWRAINTPLYGDIARTIFPSLIVIYEDLDESGQLRTGSRITYEPTRRMPFRDITFRVDELLHENMFRRDTLVSSRADGSVNRSVEAEGDTSVLIVEAELSIEGLGGMELVAAKTLLDYGVSKPTEQTLGHLQQILKSSQAA